jgi:uncharacterized protein YdhG (YjbR/CyaY superfamily)
MNIVDEYLANVPPAQKTELERIRAIIKQVAPDAEEVITYSMPGFKYKGKYLISYAAFKDHMSLFPGAEPVGVLKDTLKDNVTGKGTIQFTLEEPLSDETIKEIVHLSMGRIDTP